MESMYIYYGGTWKSSLLRSAHGRCGIKMVGDAIELLIIYDGRFMKNARRIFKFNFTSDIKNPRFKVTNPAITYYQAGQLVSLVDQKLNLNLININNEVLKASYLTHNPNDVGFCSMKKMDCLFGDDIWSEFTPPTSSACIIS